MEDRKKISATASIRFFFPDKEQAKAAYGALASESNFSHRGTSRVALDGKAVVVEISAEDLVSLRATLNSYLRLMYVIKSIEENTQEE